MSLEIRVAHDPTCPWCWIAISQAQRLREEFGVTIRWVGYELWPEALAWPEPGPPAPEPPKNKPSVPSRLELACAAEGILIPFANRPKRMRVNAAFQAIELAYEHGVGEAFTDALYRAYWERGAAIGEVEPLIEIGAEFGLDAEAIRTAVETKQFQDRIVDFDDDAYSAGVYNVPTYFIGESRYAEQPFRVLQKALERALK